MEPAAITLGNPPATGATDGSSVADRLWRRRRFFVLIFFFTMLPVLVVIFVWPPTYYAKGSIIIGSLQPSSSSPTAWIEKLGDPADLESQLIIAKSARTL